LQLINQSRGSLTGIQSEYIAITTLLILLLDRYKEIGFPEASERYSEMEGAAKWQFVDNGYLD